MALASWTDEQVLDQLNSGSRWTSSTITYAFPTTIWSMYSDGEAGFSGLNATQQARAVLAINLWDDLIEPSFVRVDAGNSEYHSDVEFANFKSTLDYAYAYYPGIGSVWFNSAYNASYGTDDLVTPRIGNHGFATFVHEIGHAIGLEHMGDYNGTADQPSSYQDSTVYSIMSYFGPSWGTGKVNGQGLVAWADWVGADGKLYSPQTPMMNDIMAIQRIYGADTTTRTGDTVYGFGSNVIGATASIYNFSKNLNPILCIWDANGNDTLNLSGWSAASTVNLAPGTFSSGNSMTLNISIARGAWIENAITGAGNDRISGNELANRLEAGSGNDVINGLAGNDILLGGNGDDTLNGGEGADEMSGGAGNDSYVVDDIGDVVVETSAVGTDTIRTTLSSYVLGNWIEVLIQTGAVTWTATGNVLANTIQGGGGENTLYGEAGDDRLIGGAQSDILDGGTGNDAMSGGAGDDIYFVDSAKDVITEALNGGVDTVRVTASSFTLSAYVDNLDYVGSGAFKGIGSADANRMTGGAGADVLDGAAGNDFLYGGLGNDSLVGGIGNDLLDGEGGADKMAGGVGNDSYYVDNIGDVVTELVSAGTDTVFTTLAAYTLGAHVENLTFDGTGGFVGTGNTLANVLTGGAGDDILSGLDGNDRLSGGEGNDTLIGGTGADTIEGGDGDDFVYFGDLWANISWIYDIATATFRFMGTLIGSDAVTGVETFRDAAGIDRTAAFLIKPGDFVPEVSIVADAPSVAEGDAVEQTVTFTVALTMASDDVETVAWSVAGSGTRPANFADILGVTSGVLSFAAGETAKTISITLRGDTKYEADETFSVVLGALSEGLWRGPSTATMTILNDETAPTYNIITGSTKAQTLTGTDGTDRISGGGGNDTLRGGLGHDVLIASSGNDTLDGGEGEDDMTGGAGNDTYIVDNIGDAAIEISTGGIDTIRTTLERYTLGAWIEGLVYTGTSSFTGIGNTLANSIVGGIGNDTIYGGAGNDTLNGGGGENRLYGEAGDDRLIGGALSDILDGGTGNDAMSGGAGDDIYVVDSAKDVVTEAVNGGVDTVRVSASSFTLSAYVDNLEYVGSGAFKGIGSADANRMTGGAGADVLDGAAGNDFLYGGLGNDSLVGGIGNDLLDGEGGADKMAGGVGNDSYYVDNIGDVVTELVSAGTDTVFTTLAAYTLGAHVENLTFDGTGGFVGTGNTLANVLTGGAGDDILSGLDGNDRLSGGEGNDTLIGGTGADTIEGGDGDDFVYFGDLWANISWIYDIATATFRFMGTLIGSDAVTGVETFRDAAGIDRTAAFLIKPGDFVPEVSIVADAPSVAEGDAVEQTVTFTVALTMASDDVETVAWSVAGSGTRPANFADILGVTSGVLSFAAGETAKTISITLRGDTKYEADETFSVVLGALSEGLWRGPSTATMTILNDETAPTYNIITGSTKAQTLTGTDGTDRISGGGGNDTLRGGLGHDVLIASSGNDTLDGGEGEDDMTGGAGNDTYIVDNIGDAAIEISTGGIDTIRTTLERYTLGAWIEGLVYTGTSSFTGIGNTLANSIVGGIGNDTIYGGAGNDTLNGGGGENRLYGEAGDDRLIGGALSDILDGGTGNDAMSGGAGDDIYVVDSAKDVVTEAVNGGVDTVRVSASSFTLSAYVDNLEYVGSGAFKGIGSADANRMTGGAGADVLDGAAGNDFLYGGLGNDSLVGGIGNDLLDGEGGADKMAGGVGNDSYYVDDIGDVVTELVSAGTDTVFTTLAAYTLGAHVENLTFDGTGGFVGTGNTLANVLTGGAGDDILSGLDGNDRLSGGEGNDTLIGGTGEDTFYFDVFGDGNADTIADFNAAADTILLDADVFGDDDYLGQLLGSAFGRGTEATNEDQRILYDQSSGNIFYDADGSGLIDPVVFARLTAGTSLEHSDFTLV
ncbi:M10 family metallopeptidase C-terminal domain-containing protein [Rhizobium sp. SL42]|uniref:M10 family metallopeptidase C-terminal domain-containing protein n=1 Tax=Rhizobium sp. SL42 TaxID=2806346 RepID=UPI001F004D8D|nr:M10 family metallopeptidase C-terminal domain-containing protein [Rhizobium sp. SL42]